MSFGSNLTHAPILKDAMGPAFASLKIVMRDANRSASSTAENATELSNAISSGWGEESPQHSLAVAARRLH
jgi:hypothetical protein